MENTLYAGEDGLPLLPRCLTEVDSADVQQRPRDAAPSVEFRKLFASDELSVY